MRRCSSRSTACATRFQAKIADCGGAQGVRLSAGPLREELPFPDLLLHLSRRRFKEFATFAEYVGPQLIKQGSVSDLMKQIRADGSHQGGREYQGVMTQRRSGETQAGQRQEGRGPPPKKVSVQDMIDEIRTKFDITDEEALYIKQVTEEKVADPAIRSTVQAHREDRIYLEGAYRGQVNGEIQTTYDERGRYDELADPKYTDTGGIFDIMAVTVIHTHLISAA